MWAYYVTERAKGHAPTGAELDRVFSTNNYGRGVLRKWRDEGRVQPAANHTRRNRHPVLTGNDIPLHRTG
jgi:hypothetical protein